MQNDDERTRPLTTLSAAEMRELQCLAAAMVPASAEYGVPGADDPRILADIAASLGRDFDAVRQALKELAALSGGAYADLPDPQRETVAEALRASDTAAVTALTRAVLQCYYRDDRVVRSLGLEPRPPFPLGHGIEQGDWSLLDPVRRRPRMWRDVPPGKGH